MVNAPSSFLGVSKADERFSRYATPDYQENNILNLLDDILMTHKVAYSDPLGDVSVASCEWNNNYDAHGYMIDSYDSTTASPAISDMRRPSHKRSRFNNVGSNGAFIADLVANVPIQIRDAPTFANLELVLKKLNDLLNSTREQLIQGNQIHAINAFNRCNKPIINRWKNLDLILPIIIPEASINIAKWRDGLPTNVQDYGKNSSASSAPSSALTSARITNVSLPDHLEKLEVLFKEEQLTSMFSDVSLPSTTNLVQINSLHTRIAVIHKCPDFMIPIIADACILMVPPREIENPIKLRCRRLSRCSVRNKKDSKGVNPYYTENWQERIETLIETASDGDESSLNTLGTFLSYFAYAVNEPIRTMLNQWYNSISAIETVPSELYNRQDARLALELRWAPSKQMKVVLAQRVSTQSSSLLTRNLDIDGFAINEIRLVHERKVDDEWDPLYPEETFTCKRILRTDADVPARVIFSQNVKIPEIRTNSLNATAVAFSPSGLVK